MAGGNATKTPARSKNAGGEKGAETTALEVTSSTVTEPATAPLVVPQIGGEPGEPQVVEKTIETVTMTVPIVALRKGEYVRPHVDLQLDPTRAETLKRIMDGLCNVEATLADGRRVTTAADAVRWILDGMKSAIDAA